MTHLTADSVAELFVGAVAVAKSGESVSPRGMATREVLDVHMRLTQPRARLLYAPPARVINPAFAVAETVWHLSGSVAPWIFDYNARIWQYADDGVLRGAYGPRMRKWAGNVDQLSRAVEILKEDPDSTCRLVYRWMDDKPAFRDSVRRLLPPGGTFWAVTEIAGRRDESDPLTYLGITAAEVETLTAGWPIVRTADLDVLRCYALRP
jgi:hypothetical protein